MRNKTFWLLTIVVFIGLLLPALVQEGMFLDGVSYACIAKNMANGLGSFALPHYTATLYPVCYEQPPLALWLQSLFFRAFGDHFLVERFFSFCMAIATAWGIVLNWRLLAAQMPGSQVTGRNNSWLPVLLWIISPIVFWGYQNNMLECTMSVFVLGSTYFAAKSEFEKQPGLLVLAAISTAAAVLCKGPVGFSPVAAPLVLSLAFEPKSVFRGAISSALMLVCALAILGIFIFFVPGMPEYLDQYLHTRLLPTLLGARDTQVEYPFSFLLDLVSQIALPAILLLIVFFKQGFREIPMPKSALFFFGVGLAGTLPLVFSPKQSAHYLLPSIPYFALGFAAIFEKAINWSALEAKIGGLFEKIVWLVLGATLVISVLSWGKYRRDVRQIKDIKAICIAIGTDRTIGIPEQYGKDWLLHAYFGRIGNESLDEHKMQEFWLGNKGEHGPAGFLEMDLGLNNYGLWKSR